MFRKIVYVKGLQITGETLEDMEIREAATEAHNARVDALYADWKRQRAMPMPAMREWARKRGLISAALDPLKELRL